MGIEFKDRTGPRSDDELKKALNVVEQRIVKVDTSDPELFLEFIVIREALMELLTMRRLIREHAERKGTT